MFLFLFSFDPDYVSNPNMNTTWHAGDKCDNSTFKNFTCEVTTKKGVKASRQVECIFFKYGPTETANYFQVFLPGTNHT